MAILSDDQRKKLEDEARLRDIRQNVKSHCTKIRDGIRKNGSTSAVRGIWELFQNAGDLVKDGQTAEIKIRLTTDSFVFSHKGKPFTDETLGALVKQVSSQEKEDSNTVGQYGTGFLTTHVFGRKIYINGSMQICAEPEVYVDVDDFVINREHFDDIPTFIEDMTQQVTAVAELLRAEEKTEAREWTELLYPLNEDRYKKAQSALDDAMKMLPYVMTFNDQIGQCRIEDDSRGIHRIYRKEYVTTQTENLHCTKVTIEEDGEEKNSVLCYYLELHEGQSRIILPLKDEYEVCSFDGLPHLYVHYPLLGDKNLGLNYMFHSHLFTPEETRDNIIVYKDNDATEDVAKENDRVLREMTHYLWNFLEQNVEKWTKTIQLAPIHIKDDGWGDEKTDAFYQRLKTEWAEEYCKLKLFEIEGNRYSLNEESHPRVFEPNLSAFIGIPENKEFLDSLYDYAHQVCLIPEKKEIIEWSQIVEEWNVQDEDCYLVLEKIVQYVSEHSDENLYSVLKMLVVLKQLDFFTKYALIPNREGTLKYSTELRNAPSVTDELYTLVRSLDANICEKFVHPDYADLVGLIKYTRIDLRDDLNRVVKAEEDKYWRGGEPCAYEGEFEKNLIALCSAFITANGESKRNKLMPIICRFENLVYKELIIPAWPEDDKNFDLYRNIFLSLVENQMMKIGKKDCTWVKEHMDDLVMFVNNARGDDYKSFMERYAIYPDMTGVLHLPGDLKTCKGVEPLLFELYKDVFGEDLRCKCVDERFATFYGKYETDENYQYTSKKIASEIQNQLSADDYKDTILLDIIDYTELDNDDGANWRTWFKTIYDQRETIRYNLGSAEERKAINRMLKQKNPELMQKMADLVESPEPKVVLEKLVQAIKDAADEAYRKMLGEFVESHVQRFLHDALADEGIQVVNEQGGQDLKLIKEGYDEYLVEVKSRWEAKMPAIMSSLQYKTAVEAADRYALISAQMWNFDQQRVERKEVVGLDEFIPMLRACSRIGHLAPDLETQLEDVFKNNNDQISASGTYEVHVPQSLLTQTFGEIIEVIKKYFS